MKTLKELENEKLKQENAKIRNLIKSYKRDDISPATKSFILAKIKQSKKAIGHISDFVKQEIAKKNEEIATKDNTIQLLNDNLTEKNNQITNLETDITNYKITIATIMGKNYTQTEVVEEQEAKTR